MSQHLYHMPIGATIDMRGPKGHMEYLGTGRLAVKDMRSGTFKIERFKELGMIAGGTGITPMLQLIQAIMCDPNDKTKLSLLFANQTEGDIFLRKEIEALAKASRGQFKIWYTVDRAPDQWAFSTGFVDKEMVQARLPQPGEDTFVVVCGPPPMIKFACTPAFEALGHTRWESF